MRHGVLDGYSRLRGVSLGDGGVDLYVVLRAGSELDTGWAVGVTGFVWVVAVDATDRGVDAGRSLPAVRQVARVGPGFVGPGADSAGRGVLAAGCMVSVLLADAALSAEAEGDVFFEPAFPVADDEVVAAQVGQLDISAEGDDDRGGLFVDSLFWGG